MTKAEKRRESEIEKKRKFDNTKSLLEMRPILTSKRDDNAGAHRAIEDTTTLRRGDWVLFGRHNLNGAVAASQEKHM